jgi:stage V sporulation protein B
MTEQKKGNSFLKGAAILGIAGIIIKIIGAFFRIPLGNIIGAEGMGYYQSAYPIYLILVVASTAGLPTAIAKMVSEKMANGDSYGADRVFKVSFFILAGIGIVTSSALFFGARYYSDIMIRNPKAYYSTMAIAPALLFVPIMSSFRGYFQGLRDMRPTAISQIVEQLARVAVGLGLAYAFLGKGIEISAAGATFGAGAGAFISAFVMMAIYARHRKNKTFNKPEKVERVSQIAKSLLMIAVPITIGASVLPVMNSIDVGIVLRRLQQIGYSEASANGLYGQLTGMATPLMNLPQIVTAAIQISLVPAVAHMVAKKDYSLLGETVKSGARVTLIIALPAAFGLVVLAGPIMRLLYPLRIESAISASTILSVLGFGIVFLSLFQSLTGVLQGLGKPLVPVWNLAAGALLKIVLTYVLVGVPSLNVRGAAIGTVCGYAMAASLNVIYIKRKLNMNLPIFRLAIKPLISAGFMGTVVYGGYRAMGPLVGSNAATVISILAGALVYGWMLINTGALTSEDFELIPRGKKLYSVLNKMKIGKW